MATFLDKLSCDLNWYCIAQSIGAARKCLNDYPLFERVSKDWQGTLVKLGLVVSITGFVLSLLSSHWVVATAFLLTTAACGLGVIYHKKVINLMSLKKIVEELTGVKDHLEKTAQELEKKNQALEEQVSRLEEMVGEFTELKEQFHGENEQLKREVAQLTLCVTTLTQGAEKLKREVEEVARRGEELNTSSEALKEGLKLLEQAIRDSRDLCREVKESFREKEEGIGGQLERLERLLQQATTQGYVAEKLRELEMLRESFEKERREFDAVRLKCAEENGRLNAVTGALEELRGQFSREITTVSGDLGANRAGLQEVGQTLGRQLAAVEGLLSRVAPLA